jgi:transposase
MPRQQRTYTTEFKQEAIRLVETSGKSMGQVARDLGIADSVLSHWCNVTREHGTNAFPGSGHQPPLEEEHRRLRRELALVQQEREIVKKTLTILTRGQPL